MSLLYSRFLRYINLEQKWEHERSWVMKTAAEMAQPGNRILPLQIREWTIIIVSFWQTDITGCTSIFHTENGTKMELSWLFIIVFCFNWFTIQEQNITHQLKLKSWWYRFTNIWRQRSNKCENIFMVLTFFELTYTKLLSKNGDVIWFWWSFFGQSVWWCTHQVMTAQPIIWSCTPAVYGYAYYRRSVFAWRCGASPAAS
jgi:hypothetical protein